MSRVPEWQAGRPAPRALGVSQVFVCGDEREVKLYGSLVAPSRITLNDHSNQLTVRFTVAAKSGCKIIARASVIGLSERGSVRNPAIRPRMEPHSRSKTRTFGLPPLAG